MKNLSRYIVIWISISLWMEGIAQNPKGTYGTFALTNATVETITKGIIEKATVLIRNGKIDAVGTTVSIPADAHVIDCTGLRIYPGFIDAGTRLGLSEVGSDPRTQDYNEIGDIVPQMKALTAINPNSVLIPVTRVNGVTTVLASPTGGVFSGTAALINLYGYTPDQMYAGFEGVVLNFPASARRGNNDKRTDDEIKKAVEKSLNQLNDIWEKVVQFHTIDSASRGIHPDYYPELEALVDVIRGNRTLLVEVNNARDILEAIKWIEEKKIKKVILTGVSEGWRVANKIANAKIHVITGPVLALPTREYDRYDKAYANAGIMQKAGVKVALRTTESENVRNLPYHAGFAATYGMGKEEALRSVTIVPAEIFGVADKLGSIEKNKNATLFVCDGDPFEVKTKIHYVFIDGWQVPLVNRQTQLYDEFLKREPGLKSK